MNIIVKCWCQLWLVQDAVSLNMLLLTRLTGQLLHCITSTRYLGYIFLSVPQLPIAYTCAHIYIYSWVTQGMTPIQVRYADGERERIGVF